MKQSAGLMYLLMAMFQYIFIPVDRNSGLGENRVGRLEQDTAIKKVFIPEKINLASFLILAVNDTAYKTEDIGRLLNKNYGELYKYCGQHKLRPGKMMAFYYTSRLPFVFDAAVEVNALPTGFTDRIKGKEIKGGEAIVVHYQGPYDQIGPAYAAITKWLQENNKKALQQPFEVYLNDPITVKDPKQLRTDVYQRLQ